MFRTCVVLLSLGFLTSCYQGVLDGKFAEEHLEVAKSYHGVYSGYFEGRKVDVEFKIQTDRTAVLSVHDGRGDSQLVEGCSSQIKQLFGV